MRCPHFPEPEYAAKKEEAFKRVRRGINHIEQDCVSNEADDLREAIDPLDQHDDQYILHVAHEQLSVLEMEMVMIGEDQNQPKQTQSQCVAQTELVASDQAQDVAEPYAGDEVANRAGTDTATGACISTTTATATGAPVRCVGVMDAEPPSLVHSKRPVHSNEQAIAAILYPITCQQELGQVPCTTNEPIGEGVHATGQAPTSTVERASVRVRQPTTARQQESSSTDSAPMRCACDDSLAVGNSVHRPGG